MFGRRPTILLGTLTLLGAGESTGIVVMRTSRDSVTVAALQQHSSEVTELVRDGMAAMHRAMMNNGEGMMGRGMMERNPGP